MNTCFLGIDTSNYTTSIAVVDLNGHVLFDKRIVLTVKPGEIGLRQSDAFYQHVMNLPGIFFELPQDLIQNIAAIGVSCRPRNVEGSYMPVFNAGVQFAKVIAKSLNCPLYHYAHQDGHVMAALEPDLEVKQLKLLNLHVSGGTTELFTSQWSEVHHYFETHIIGGSKDLSIGQLIDRIGVYLNFPFPSGPAMEKHLMSHAAALQLQEKYLPLKLDNGFFNLSGIENKIKQLHEKGIHQDILMLALFTELGEMLYKLLNQAIKTEKPDGLILAGGVMSNHWIRQALQRLANGYPNLKFIMTPTKLCTDNAVGIAKMAARRPAER